MQEKSEYNIYEIVEEILKKTPETRSDDFLLVIKTYVKMGYARRIPLGVVIEFKNIENAPAFESITRCRREIQNTEGRFLPEEEIENRRRNKQEKMRWKYSEKKQERTTHNNSTGWMGAWS